jgi:hypothetical protein
MEHTFMTIHSESACDLAFIKASIELGLTDILDRPDA